MALNPFLLSQGVPPEKSQRERGHAVTGVWACARVELVVSLTEQLSHETKNWWLRVYRGWNPTQMYRDYFINHDVRIPINQPGFHGRVFFFSWLNWQKVWERPWLGGGNSNSFHLCSPGKLGKMKPFWQAYVSNGLVQPPTRLLNAFFYSIHL